MTPPIGETGSDNINLRRAAKFTAWLAIAHSLLVFASIYLLSVAPGPSAPDEEYLTFYANGGTRLILVAGLYLMPFAGIAFLWFIVMLRMWIRRTAATVDELFSSVQLVSGILFVGLFLSAAAVVSVLALGAGSVDVPIDPSTARQFTELTWALVTVFSMRMAAVFIVTTTTLGRRHRFLPAWFVVMGYLVGAFLLLSASIASYLILVFPVWVLLLGLLLLSRARSLRMTTGPVPYVEKPAPPDEV